jgi:hypothetical protein
MHNVVYHQQLLVLNVPECAKTAGSIMYEIALVLKLLSITSPQPDLVSNHVAIDVGEGKGEGKGVAGER